MNFLLKGPKKWTQAHIEAVNLSEHDEIAVSAIVGVANLTTSHENCKWRKLAEEHASIPQCETSDYIFAGEHRLHDTFLSPLRGVARSYPASNFHLATVNVKGKHPCEIAFYRLDDLYMNNPFIVSSVACGSREESKIKQEVPQALLQMVMAYDQTPDQGRRTRLL